MSLALLFPGQGSQKVGMGQALVTAFPESRAAFDETDAAWNGW
jgi:[acyl-carrier-protein] S-malonyltransferase